MSDQEPPYNVARGQSDTLSLIPPVVFTGVTLRYIPLPARMDRLQRFIDRFLNLGTRNTPAKCLGTDFPVQQVTFLF